jgi:hypothetical protein
MASLHVIYDEGNRVRVTPPPGQPYIKGVYSATVDVGNLQYDHPAEVEELVGKLTKLLLETIGPAITDEAPAPDQT